MDDTQARLSNTAQPGQRVRVKWRRGEEERRREETRGGVGTRM